MSITINDMITRAIIPLILPKLIWLIFRKNKQAMLEEIAELRHSSVELSHSIETADYFCKKLHLRSFTGFWIRLWSG